MFPYRAAGILALRRRTADEAAASKVKLHHQEMQMTQMGSPLAIENAHRNLLDMEDDE